VPSDDARLATVEAVLRELRDDVTELRDEGLRQRTRLHNLEGVAASFLDAQKENRRKEALQYQRLGLRIQVLTLVVGFAAVATPIVVVLLAGK